MHVDTLQITTLTELVISTLIKSAILAFGLLTSFAYMTYIERKVMAYLQLRVGPNRAGPFGLLQPAADGLKVLFKEELIPAQADKVIFVLAPIITVIPALIIMAVVPFAPDLPVCWPKSLAFTDWTCYMVPLRITDINVGILFVLSIAAIAVYGIVLAGWSSSNKYATLGGLRSSAQMVSYELSLGLAIVGPVLVVGSLSLGAITAWQQNHYWLIVTQPLGFLIYFIATLAEVNRAPFDMPEAEQELTAGYITEYSGLKFSLFFMAEYIKMVAVSGIGVTLFLGGFSGPFITEIAAWTVGGTGTLPGLPVGALLAAILGLVYFIGKTLALLVFMIWIRASLPRLRYDQLMRFGWKLMLPLALANVAVTAVALVVLSTKIG
jgi:NADH-quinone oxidoreductase subunit H